MNRAASATCQPVKLAIAAVVLLVLPTLVTACGSAQPTMGQPAAHDVQMAALNTMPTEAQAAPVVVQEAYQFAAANPQMLQQLPCYCGCGKVGHTSNYDCYISGVASTGQLTIDTHALGCSICVDITQDAMRLMRQGVDPAAIRAYVDQTYARYGPSNMSAE